LKLQIMNHPHGSLQNSLTFMSCIWKSRNDWLFDRKKDAPHQIYINAQGLCNNPELYSSSDPVFRVQKQVQAFATNLVQPPGSTIKTDQTITVSKFFSDAAWKTTKSPRAQGSIRTRLGIFCQFQEANDTTKVFIQASKWWWLRAPLI
jgi:hypothetical protein